MQPAENTILGKRNYPRNGNVRRRTEAPESAAVSLKHQEGEIHS